MRKLVFSPPRYLNVSDEQKLAEGFFLFPRIDVRVQLLYPVGFPESDVGDFIVPCYDLRVDVGCVTVL